MWCFVVVSDGLRVESSLRMTEAELHTWDQQPQQAEMVRTLTAVVRVSSDRWEGLRGAEELHCLWMAASSLTLWRSLPLSVPSELCENPFNDTVVFFSFLLAAVVHHEMSTYLMLWLPQLWFLVKLLL